MEALLGWLIFLGAIGITIMLHELGHLISALLLGIKVKEFSLGFGKPLIKFKLKGIKFKFSPLLLGGYVKLAGMESKVKNGFMSKPYWKKMVCIMSGLFMNAMILVAVYLFTYGSIIEGLKLDMEILILRFQGYPIEFHLLHLLSKGRGFTLMQHIGLLQLSIINLGCLVSNMLPIPPLDGSYSWILWLEKFMPFKKFVATYKKILAIGWAIVLPLFIYIFIRINFL